MDNTIKVIIADNHRMMLDGLKAIINTSGGIKVTGMAYNGHHVLQLVEAQPATDVVVLDVEMPVLGGLDTTKKIKERYPHIKVLALTMYSDNSYVTAMVQAGVSGYILKNKGSNELISAIRAVHKGETYFGKAIADILIQSLRKNKKVKQSNGLTKREKEVLSLIGEGLTAKEIAANLCIAPTTVETHRRHLIEKLGEKNTKHLIRYALKNGFTVT